MKVTYYARIVTDKNGGNAFYKISITPHHLYLQHMGGEWHGPYRDKTDAENAAQEEATTVGIELDWVD